MSDKTEDQIREGLKLLAEDVQPPEGEVGRHTRTWFLPSISPRIGAALAGAAICATVGALAAAGTFSGGHKPAAQGPAGPARIAGPMIPAIVPLLIAVNRASDGTLSSVDVRVHSSSANDSVELRVYHSTGGGSVVYTTHVTTGRSASSCPTGSTGQNGPTGQSGPTGASGPVRDCVNMGSTWSGTLVPSDWDGGCQSTGYYWVFAEGLRSQTFTCDAPQAGPTGSTGPTGAAGPAG